MKKRIFGRKLSRGGGARKALFKSLTRALVLYGRITTTRAKGKAIIGEIEKLVRLARMANNEKAVASFFGGDRKITDIFVKLSRSFKDTKGGFLRIINLPSRKGDAAQMLRLEWTQRAIESKKDDIKKTENKVLRKKDIKTGEKNIKEEEIKKEK